jgi:hypothetical protein
MPRLQVQLEPKARKDVVPGEFGLRATFTNASEKPAELNVHQAGHPSLTLEVRDERDQPVPMPPPSAPDELDLAAPEEIQPGASVTIEYAGILDRSLAAGTYRVRYFSPHLALGGTADDPLQSEWVEFTVRPTEFSRGRRVAVSQAVGRARWLSWVLDLLDRLRKLLHRLYCVVAALIFRKRCDRVLTVDVDEPRTETISNAPAGSEAWNGPYGWRARFRASVDEANCRVTVTVRVRLSGAITDAQRTAWETAIENAWSNRFKLCCECCCCQDGYTIVCDIQFVARGEDQVVNVGTSTTNMGNWGANDTVDVGHEFGHMLGALDEYFTVNGVDYDGARRADGTIMNNPANNPAAHHYDLIRAAVQQLLGTMCSTRPVGQPC